jgi:protein-L-isoaspartate(D-aspartate) O-methyltransferase
MAHIVGETGRVVTVDIDDDIVANAQEHLRTAGFERVQVVCGDGALGYPHAAPYDRVILTAAAADIAPAWREQLAPHGRLVLPLELTPLALKNTTPALVTFKRADGYLESVALHACGFMPLRGSLAMHRTGVVPLGPEAGLTLVTAHPVEAAAMYTALTSPYRDTATGIRVTPREVGGLRLWLALLDAGFCYLYAEGAMTQRGLVPFLAGDPGTFVTAMGLAEETTLCLLILSPNAHPQLDQPLDADKPVELVARSFDTGTALSRRLTAQAIAWEKAGRPFAWSPQWTIQRGRISAYPLGTPYSRAANQAVVDKRSVRLVFTW